MVNIVQKFLEKALNLINTVYKCVQLLSELILKDCFEIGTMAKISTLTIATVCTYQLHFYVLTMSTKDQNLK